jgi:hypothetical protein
MSACIHSLTYIYYNRHIHVTTALIPSQFHRF